MLHCKETQMASIYALLFKLVFKNYYEKFGDMIIIEHTNLFNAAKINYYLAEGDFRPKNNYKTAPVI